MQAPVQCESCQSNAIGQYESYNYVCEDCGLIQAMNWSEIVFAEDLIQSQRIKNTNRKKKPQKSNYVKKGKDNQIRTEYLNKLKPHLKDERLLDLISVTMTQILYDNEMIIQSLASFMNIFTINYNNKVIKRNTFIELNSVIFYCLFIHKQWEVLHNFTQNITNKSMKKLFLLYELIMKNPDQPLEALKQFSFPKLQYLFNLYY